MEENVYQREVALPNSSVILVLGIISIIGCCCYGIVGVICGIIAWVMANSAQKLYQENPEHYTKSSLQNVNAGKICGIIGIIASVLYAILIIWAIVTIGIDVLKDPELLQEWIQQQQMG
jgi:hypothetical protein